MLAPAPTQLPPEPAAPGRRGGFASIVAFVFSLDVEEEFDRLKGTLKLPTKPSQCDYGTVADALDQASENARLALQLTVVAKSMLDDMAATKAALEAPLYQAAKDRLQQAKAQGTATKQITNDDVRAMAMQMYPQEFAARDGEHSRAKRTVEYLDGLTTCWNERVKTLRQMVAASRNV